MCHIFFIHSSVDGHLGCFPFMSVYAIHPFIHFLLPTANDTAYFVPEKEEKEKGKE